MALHNCNSHYFGSHCFDDHGLNFEICWNKCMYTMTLIVDL